MPHVKGHIIKKANQSSALEKYQKSGEFYHYRFKVTEFEGREMRFLLSDSFEPGSYGNNIVILSKENYDQIHLKMSSELEIKIILDLVLLPQSVFNYASDWSLDNRNNWMVFDPAKQITH